MPAPKPFKMSDRFAATVLGICPDLLRKLLKDSGLSRFWTLRTQCISDATLRKVYDRLHPDLVELRRLRLMQKLGHQLEFDLTD